jgi:hydroxyacyl-ACP dehydratase HTD2-like protein with hotdog domain
MKFEDIAVGDEVVLVKGPLSPMHLVRWSAAMENWHRIHYDHRFATGHDGLPGLLVNGSFKQQFVLQLLKDWAGDEGWVWKAGFQFRAMNLAGETLRVWARVTHKRRVAQFGLAELELGILNDQDVESTPGSAVVALPYRDGPPVPYPFVPPEA